MKYYETQTMKRLWICYAAILLIIITIARNYYFGYGLLANIPFLFLIIIATGIYYLCRLDMAINSVGFRYRFKPFHLRDRVIEWKDIQQVWLRKYHPFWEYRGWGISYGKAGWAYSTQGNIGLQLELKNGKRILVGTQRPHELEDFLTKLKGRHAIPLVSLTEKRS
ncbi:hypothetical protein [Olivibacter sp. XZL3]|uniref:hypothetical protein n=1 Tax=Olivibacter sp. XZL3 TaxID=1735116 RepID=UPI001065EE99|nr:hypothetical protein [Olivibacter sp. XZL3]